MRFAIFILALMVRIAAIELTGAEKVHFGDAPDYLATAGTICEQQIYPERGNLPFFRAPGFPFFIALTTACEPQRVRAVKYALAACDAMTVVFVVLISQWLWSPFRRDQRYAAVTFFAAVLAIPHPLYVASVTDIRSEPLFTMLLTGSMWLVVRRPVASGIVIALATLTRPTALIAIPLFALFLWMVRREGSAAPEEPLRLGPRRSGPGAALLFLAAAGLTLAPWTVRNYLRFGEVIVVNDAAGFNLWRGTHPDLLEIVKLEDPAEFARRSAEFEGVIVPEVARTVEARAATPSARDREWRRLAVENVRADPALAIRSAAEKALMFWRPWLHPAEHGAAAMALSLMVSLTLFIGGAVGMAQFPDRRLVIAALLFLGVVWLAHLPYIPTIRLRMPFTDPLLMAFTAGALSAATAGVRRDWRTFAPLLALVGVVIAVTLAAARLAHVPAAAEAIESIRSAATAWWAIPLFVLVYVVFALLLLPVGALSAAAAVAWGWKVGGTVELVACTIAAIAPYLLARRGLSGWVERRIRAAEVPALASPFTLFILRIVPVVPYVALNYIAGAVRVRPREFILTTFAGSIPSVFLFAYFVDTMAQGAMGRVTQAKIFAVCVLIATAAVVMRAAARRIRAQSEPRSDA